MLADRVRMGVSGDLLEKLPGAKEFRWGDMSAGFFGETPTSELWTGDSLGAEIGLIGGTSQFSNEPWLKFAIDNKVIYKCKKTYRYGIPWNNINDAGAVHGEVIVSKNGISYKVRLMRGVNTDPTSTATTGNENSEWNKLIIPTTDRGVMGYGAYGDSDLNVYDIYHNGLGCAHWCKESMINQTDAIYRGRFKVIYSNQNYKTNNNPLFGWSPVLEVVM